jgi:SSS family solute:Na+ symporter
VVAGFLVMAAVLTLTASTLMLTVLNLVYNLLAQVVPGWLAVLFARRVRAAAVATGMVVGVISAVALYASGVTKIGGINAGLVSLGLNLLIVFGWSLLSPGTRRAAVAQQGARAESAPVAVAGN